MSTRVYEGPGKSEDIERGAPGRWAVSDPWCGKQGRRHWRRSACEGRPWREGWNRGIPYLIALQKCAFYKLKARPSNKKITTCFIKSLALLWWSATEPTISPRYACTHFLPRGLVCVHVAWENPFCHCDWESIRSESGFLSSGSTDFTHRPHLALLNGSTFLNGWKGMKRVISCDMWKMIRD